MSFYKLDITRTFMKPDGSGFFKPTELWTSRYDYLFEYGGYYYIVPNDFQIQVEIDTNSQDLLNHPDNQHDDGIYVYKLLIKNSNFADCTIINLDFNGQPVIKLTVFTEYYYKPNYLCLLFFDGSNWVLRDIDNQKCYNNDVAKIFFKELPDPEPYKRDGDYSSIISTYDTYWHNNATIADPDDKDFLLKAPSVCYSSSSFSGTFKIHSSDMISTSDITNFLNPPNWDDTYQYYNTWYLDYHNEANNTSDTSFYHQEYIVSEKTADILKIYTIAKMEIDFTFKYKDIYKSSSLAGVYTHMDNSSYVKKLGSLQFIDTDGNTYIKGDNLFYDNGYWFANDFVLNQEPTETQTAYYEVPDGNGGYRQVVVSFSEYVSVKKEAYHFSNSVTGGL